jgi:hypothetical protein
MTRAYLRLDPQFDERKESYPDGPYRALIATFCEAESQPMRGRFRSLDYLGRLLGKSGKHVRYLIDHGDLMVLEDGKVYVVGWDEWQEGDWKVGERVRRIRNRRNGAGNGRCNGLDNGMTVPVARLDLHDSAGGGAGVAEAGERMSDDERRANLDRLHAQMKAHGLIPPKETTVLDSPEHQGSGTTE